MLPNITLYVQIADKSSLQSSWQISHLNSHFATNLHSKCGLTCTKISANSRCCEKKPQSKLHVYTQFSKRHKNILDLSQSG